MIGLYFGGQWFKTNFGNDFGNIELDATLSENHAWSAEATMNPVEEGSPITDHVIEQPDKLTLTGFVSETPLVASASVRGKDSVAWAESITQPLFDLLYDLIKAREVITVYTQYKIYEDMVMTSLNIPRSAAIGEAIEFNAEFVNVRFVSTQYVDVPAGISASKTAKTTTSVANKSEPPKDGGKKQATTVTPAKQSSTLARIFN